MRTFAVVILALLVIFAPYWLYLPAIFAGIIYFDLFVEGIVLGFFVDLLYGRALYHGFLLGFPFTIASVVLVCVSVFVREKIRLYA